MTTQNKTLTFVVQPGAYAIAKLPHNAELPAWACSGPFFSVTRTSEELSIVVAENSLPQNFEASNGWRLLKLQGPFAFDEVGIVAAISEPLAKSHIGIFIVSTYNTDYLLVQNKHVRAAVETLDRAGHRILHLELLDEGNEP
jgi:uncharacterized protein